MRTSGKHYVYDVLPLDMEHDGLRVSGKKWRNYCRSNLANFSAFWRSVASHHLSVKSSSEFFWEHFDPSVLRERRVRREANRIARGEFPEIEHVKVEHDFVPCSTSGANYTRVEGTWRGGVPSIRSKRGSSGPRCFSRRSLGGPPLRFSPSCDCRVQSLDGVLPFFH